MVLIILSINGYSQSKKNTFEIGVLGNIGFLNVGYDREVLHFKKFNTSIETKIGYVPGSKGEEEDEEEKNSTPNFIHLNFGTGINYKTYSSRIGLGISYSKILIGYDKSNAREKSNYNRLLGELNYSYYFEEIEGTRTGLKLSFAPILYDDGANDVQNIPIRVSFLYEF